MNNSRTRACEHNEHLGESILNSLSKTIPAAAVARPVTSPPPVADKAPGSVAAVAGRKLFGVKRRTRERERCPGAALQAVVFLCLAAATLSCAALDPPVMGPAIGPDKKLIKWGADTPNSAYVREHARDMEQWPFDGIVIHADVMVEGQRQWLHGQMFSTRKFTYDELEHIVADFKAAGLRRFTDNFMVMSQSIDAFVFKDENGKETHRQELFPPDWFNDEEFAVTKANWGLAARICKEAGLAGFMLDFEMWPTTNGKYPRAWNYAFCRDHNDGDIPSFEECRDKVRQRGRELTAAVCEAYPDITMINYAGMQEGAWRRVGVTGEVTADVHPLSASDYGLFASFLDGMLEGIPEGSKATIVDGGAMYHANLDKRFKGYRKHTFARSAQVTEAPDAFAKHVRQGFAVWVDGRGWRTNPDWSWPWQQAPPYWANQFTPEELENAYYFALLNADKYVWVWAERATFFPDSGFRWPGPCTVSDDYKRALANVKRPHRMVFERDDRGALSDPPAPKLPPYDEDELFGPLAETYEYVADLPETWRFWADAENISTFGGGSIGAPDWELDGESYGDWDTIRISDYWENQGVKFNGHAWYHTEFSVPASLAGRKIFLLFGGITLHPVVGAQVHVNGNLIWSHTGVEPQSPVLVLDITKAAKPGGRNMVAVKIYNYGGPGGIYRPVKLATLRETE